MFMNESCPFRTSFKRSLCKQAFKGAVASYTLISDLEQKISDGSKGSLKDSDNQKELCLESLVALNGLVCFFALWPLFML